MNIISFIESLNRDERDFLDNIYNNAIYDLYTTEPYDIHEMFTVTDTVEDTRQIDFLKELGMSDEDLKEATEVKNHCKGGK